MKDMLQIDSIENTCGEYISPEINWILLKLLLMINLKLMRHRYLRKSNLLTETLSVGCKWPMEVIFMQIFST